MISHPDSACHAPTRPSLPAFSAISFTPALVLLGILALVGVSPLFAGPPCGDFLVSELTDEPSNSPRLEAHPGTGASMVVWNTRADSMTSSHLREVRARLFDSSGFPTGAQFEVSTVDSFSDGQPSVAVDGRDLGDGGGNFLVVRRHDPVEFGDRGDEIRGRLFDSDGLPKGAQFQVSTLTTGPQGRPAVAARTATGEGGFLVAWQSPTAASELATMVAQRFDSAGTRIGDELILDSDTAQVHYEGDVAYDRIGDRFIVVWKERPCPSVGPQYSDISALRLATDGTRIGDELRVSIHTESGRGNPRLATDPITGSFVVSWENSNIGDFDGSSYSVRARRYAAADEPFAPTFQVNTFDFGFQGEADVTLSRSPGGVGEGKPFYVRTTPAESVPGLGEEGIVGTFPGLEGWVRCDLRIDGFESGEPGGWADAAP